MERRLSAILAADIIGYSRMVGADEGGTLDALRTLRAEFIEPSVHAVSGRVVKYLGDGFIAEFSSASAALDCAERIQTDVAKFNANLPEERRIRLRMGLNQGEVVLEDDDIYGETVNIASRLEGLSPPEGIALSQKVYSELADRTRIDFDDMGPQDLKNIRQSVRVYCARLAKHAEGSIIASSPGRTGQSNLSIAVMPFRNMSGTGDTDYLADGVTEDLVALLTRFPSLFVAGRSATIAYRDKDFDLREVARDLGVRYVLEGSVRAAGPRVRVSVQLIDAGAGNHIWADRYDRLMDDIFDLQDEISNAIAARIQPELEHAERDRAQRKAASDLGAWDLYHRGMWHFYRFTPDDSDLARECFRKAIATDPGFAPPYAGLAYQLCYDVWNYNVDDFPKTLDEAEQLVRKGIALDDRDVRARFTYGRVLNLKRDYPGAIREFRRGLELSPAFAQMHHGLAFALFYSGHAEEALPYFDNAIRLSPQDPQLTSFLFVRCFAYIALGEYEKARDSGDASVAQPNAMVWSHLFRLGALGHLGDHRCAPALAELQTLSPGFGRKRWRERLYFADCDAYLESLMEGLRLAGMPE